MEPIKEKKVNPERGAGMKDVSRRGFLRAAAGASVLGALSAILSAAVPGKLKQAIAEGDQQAAHTARDAMWEVLYPMYKGVYDQAEAWNNLAARTVEQDLTKGDS